MEELIEKNYVNIVGQMILIIDEGSQAPEPYFTKLVVHSAISSFTAGRDHATKQANLWEVQTAMRLAPELCAGQHPRWLACPLHHSDTMQLRLLVP